MVDLQVLSTVAETRALTAGWRHARESIALVPTMGNLHAGHLSLARIARGEAARVVATIFVNPTQFAPSEDFAAYPRTPDVDRQRLAASGDVHAVLVPSEREIYPFGAEDAVGVTLPPLSRELCGASRPGHFEGVAAVVCRLLNIVQPDVLVLGEKDYQQLILVRRMIEDLRLPVRVVAGPTQREPDGLAMSSRNRYLDPAERAQAPLLHATLARVRDALRAGARDFSAVEAEGVRRLQAAGFAPEYVAVRRSSDLGEARENEPLIVVAAARLGKTRLIDNLRV